MPTLKWEAKKDSEDLKYISLNHNNFLIKELLLPRSKNKPIDLKTLERKYSPNLLIFGNNKLIMEDLLKDFNEKIDLIYIDPPFATGGNFSLKIRVGNGRYYENVRSYSDSWKKGIDSYLNFLYARLILMKKLLSKTGSIYVHLDWHISHYVKIILDEIFGQDNFRNEIIWMYPAASARTRNFFIRSYDTILFYTKTDDYVFNDDPQIYMEYSKRVKNALQEDEKGKFYYRGGSHNGKKLSRKVYVKHDGIFPRDIWNDIPYVRANTVEYQGFSTQKPERLLKRIILASTNKDQLVADFFCGSGTTLLAAEKLGRRWIGCDSMVHSINICRKRLLSIKKSYDLYDWKKEYKEPPKPFIIKQLKSFVHNLVLDEELLISDDKNVFKRGKPELKLIIKKEKKRVRVNLTDYQIPYVELIKQEVRSKIRSFLDWIDYWSVDFKYNGDMFCPDWWCYRTAKDRSLSSESRPYQYENDDGKNQKIAIKVIDIFGIETTREEEIKL